MAFDGTVVAAIRKELQDYIVGGRVYKIYQPEEDEINLVIKNQKETSRLMLSANASLPLVYRVSQNKENPMTAPNFCMLLRKHIGNARIIAVEQPAFERILIITMEHLDEMGDLCRKKLIIEIMGKHSNIIFVDEENRIIDAIKHISAQTSSVREVLPGRDYVLPPGQGKSNPLEVTKEMIAAWLQESTDSVWKVLCGNMTGISKVLANELCYRSKLDGTQSTASLTEPQRDVLATVIMEWQQSIIQEEFYPVMYVENQKPEEFASIKLEMYGDCEEVKRNSISEILELYYSLKDTVSRMHQKSTDLRKIVSTAIERTAKKLDIQRKQLADTKKREKMKLYGELLQTYAYSIEEGVTQCTVLNYYDNTEITIPLDATKSAMENSQAYFNKYQKLKRTYEASLGLVEESSTELEYLLSVQTGLELALTEADLTDVKRELIQSGYIRFHAHGKKEREGKSKPMHYISSDGFHMFVGKNNYQNDELTFKVASGEDWWFHAKQMPGSHVIVKMDGAKELPDRTFEEAARLAAYYSSGRGTPKVEIDYTKRMHLKKPPKAKPGFVIYHTNYSMAIAPDIYGIEEFTI